MEKKLEKIANFRDVGSLVNKVVGTQLIREKALFRSARPDRASSSDLSYLMEEVGIKTILDLRGKSEIPHIKEPVLLHNYFARVTLKPSKSPDTQPAVLSSTPPHLVTFNSSVESLPRENKEVRIWYQLDFSGYSFFLMTNIFVRIISGLLFFTGFKRLAVAIFMYTTMNRAGLAGLNTNFVDRCQSSLRDSLRLVADPNNRPILIHCSQGKDRTGIVVALTLHILGVDENAIIEDYKLSREGLEAEAAAMLEEMRSVGMDPVFLESPPEVIRETLAYIRRKYGSIDRYLDQIGFGEEDRSRMRSALLTSSSVL